MDEKTKKLKILDVTIIEQHPYPLPANQSVAHCGNHCGACGDLWNGRRLR